MSTNGLLSFGLPFTHFTSGGLNFDSVFSPPLIAPFWDDVDVRNDGGTIYYRQDNTSSIVEQIQQDISLQFHNIGFFYPSLVFIATWDRVAPYGFLPRDSLSRGLVNTFQVVVASDETRTFVRFNYGDIQWGGSGTLIGVSIGDRANFISHPASLSQSVLSFGSSTTKYFDVGCKFAIILSHVLSLPTPIYFSMLHLVANATKQCSESLVSRSCVVLKGRGWPWA